MHHHDFRLVLPALMVWVVVSWRLQLPALIHLLIGVCIALLLILYRWLKHSFFIVVATLLIAVSCAGISNSVYVKLTPGLMRYGNELHVGSTSAHRVMVGNKIRSNPDFFPDIYCIPQRLIAGMEYALQSRDSSHSEIIRGVVLGNDQNLPPILKENMRISGLSHLTAVSGAHMSLVIGVVLTVLGRRKPKLTGSVALFLLVQLMLLVGGQASVYRAGIMGALVIGALILRRRADAIPLLAITVIICSFLLPDMARSLGFRLSVVATFAIVVFANWFSLYLEQIIPYLFAQLISVPLIAGIATMPFIFAIQPKISLFTVFANMVVAPVIVPLTLGGLFAAVSSVIFPCLVTPLLAICEFSAWWIVSVANFIGNIFPIFSTPLVFVLNLLFLGGLIVSVRIIKKWRSYNFSVLFTPVFIIRLLILLIIIILLIFSLYFVSGKRVVKADDWEIIQCDVGQGSALLARKQEQTVLVDVGPQNGYIGKCLRNAGVQKIDLLILSHFDLDHVGALSQVLKQIVVSQVWVSENPYPSYNSVPIIQNLRKRNIPLRRVRAGAHFANWLEIISPNSPAVTTESINDDSLVVRIYTLNFKTLVLSDVSREVQNKILWENKWSKIDVVVVAHHGSRSQSLQLASRIQPKISLFSTGKNSYGHPTKTALRIWNAPILQTTQKCGEIRISPKSVASSCLDME